MPKKSKHFLPRIIALLILFILILLIVSSFASGHIYYIKNKILDPRGSRIYNLIKTPTATPTPSSTPIPSPTPTPEPPKGFCLQVPVIFYHHIQPAAEALANKQTNLNVNSDIFEEQMKYLNDHGYKTISAEELVNALLNHQELGKTVVVTIDDGYDDGYKYAFPIAKKNNIVLNLMIPTGLLENPGYLTWGQLSEMVNSGTVYAYDHTWSHYPPRGDLSKLEWEIVTAKKQLEDHLGKSVKIFAYPFGTIGSAEISILQKNGFLGSFTTIPSSWQCEYQIFTLPRIRIGNASLSYYGF